MGSADDDAPLGAPPPSGERRRPLPRVASQGTLPRVASQGRLRRQSLLPASVAVARGVCLAVATMLLTVALVLSLHVGAGGNVRMRHRAEALVDVLAERALDSTNTSAWRKVVLASFSPWYGTRRGASAVLLNVTEDVQAANDTVTVVEKIELDPNRKRTVHRNPRDTSWQQFTVVKPAGVEARSVWNGSDIVNEYMNKENTEDAPPGSVLDAIGSDLKPWQGGISQDQIEQLYCGLGEASLRIQIINNLAYVIGESKSRFQQRHHRLKLQIQEFIQKYQGDELPPNSAPQHGTRNVDFIIWTGDGYPPDERLEDGKSDKGPCNVTWGPMFATGRQAAQRDSPVVLVPDETFLSGLPDADVPPWQELQPKLWAIKNDHTWAKRRPEILFRGARSTPARLELFKNRALLDSPLTDFAFTDAGDDDAAAGFVKPEDGYLHPTYQCGTRYILHMEGHTVASSLRYGLACGSVVLWPRDPGNYREEFFHPMLKDGVQLRILDPVTPDNLGQHILKEVERLETAAEASNVTARLAKRAGAFADYHLAGGYPYHEWRLQYWKQVVNQYATMQDFTLKEPHPDAVPLENSIARGEHYTDLPPLVDARNCSVCKAFGWGQPEEAANRQAVQDAERDEFNKRRAKVGAAADKILSRRRAKRKQAEEERVEKERKEAEEKEAKEKAKRDERADEQKRAEEERAKAEKEKERAALEADEAALQAAKAKEEAEKAAKGTADEQAEQQAEVAEKAEEAKEAVEAAEARDADGKAEGDAGDKDVQDAANQMAEDAAKAAADGRRLLARGRRLHWSRVLRRLALQRTLD